MYFLSELRKRFTISLKDSCNDFICPENSQLFPAIGAALLGQKENCQSLKVLYNKAEKITDKKDKQSIILTPLFENERQYKEFKDRHEKAKVKWTNLEDYKGKGLSGNR